MGKSRANTYQHSPFIAALLGGLGDYFGSDATVDPTTGTVKANNFLAKPRAKELEQEYAMQQLLGQLGVKNAISQATQLEPINVREAGEKTSAVQGALNKAELDQILAKSGPNIIAALNKSGLAQGSIESQNAATKANALLPSEAKRINYATIAGKGGMASDENIGAYNMITPDILAKEKSGIGLDTIKNQIGTNAALDQETIRKATHPNALKDAILKQGLAALTTEHQVSELPETFKEQDAAKRQEQALKESQIRSLDFHPVGPGGIFSIPKQQILEGTQRSQFGPAGDAAMKQIFGGTATPSYNSSTSAGTNQPVRAPIDNSSIANPQDWIRDSATGELVNFRTGERVNPATGGKGAPTPSTITAAPPIVTPNIATPATSVTPPVKKNPIIEEVLKSLTNPQPNTSNLPRGWEIGPDGNPRQKRTP